jgi:APA family basic amino acid/polyamine antiporter
MIGAGVFSAVGVAARAAGNAAVVSLAVAAALAYCNATSSASLAALHPEAGGAYVYGRRRLGERWGFLAGWVFVVGKVSSCAAMALTFGSYVAPGHARPLALAAVAALTALNTLGVRKTVLATRVIVTLVLAALALAVFAMLAGGAASAARLWPLDPVGPRAVLEGAGLLFFAFAGYARLATLGEEVVDPARTIPRAIPLALGLTLAVYAAVVVGALATVGAPALGASAAPLVDAIRAGRHASFAGVVRGGAALASLGVLLSLLVGVSRTAFAMAAAGDLPGWLAAVHPRHRVPHRAELVVGVTVLAWLAVADLRGAIGMSSFNVLIYYAVTNAAALTLSPAERRWPRALAAFGLAGCALVAVSLPRAAVAAGVAAVVAGLVVFSLARARRAAGPR